MPSTVWTHTSNPFPSNNWKQLCKECYVGRLNWLQELDEDSTEGGPQGQSQAEDTGHKVGSSLLLVRGDSSGSGHHDGARQVAITYRKQENQGDKHGVRGYENGREVSFVRRDVAQHKQRNEREPTMKTIYWLEKLPKNEGDITKIM